MFNYFGQLLISKDISSKKDAVKYIEFVMSELSEFQPELYNYVEPVDKKIDMNNLIEIVSSWNGRDFYLKRKNPKVLITVMNGKQEYIYGSLKLTCSLRKNVETPELMNFISKGASLLLSEFGFYHSLVNELDFVHELNSDVSIYSKFKNPNMYVSSFLLKKYIPNLYWFTVLGPVYTKFFGRKKIRSIPCHSVVEISKDTFGIQLTESIMDVGSDFEAYKEIRENAKRHLGKEAFFDPELGKDYYYKSPVFPEGFAEHIEDEDDIFDQIMKDGDYRV